MDFLNSTSSWDAECDWDSQWEKTGYAAVGQEEEERGPGLCVAREGTALGCFLQKSVDFVIFLPCDIFPCLECIL